MASVGRRAGDGRFRDVRANGFGSVKRLVRKKLYTRFRFLTSRRDRTNLRVKNLSWKTNFDVCKSVFFYTCIFNCNLNGLSIGQAIVEKRRTIISADLNILKERRGRVGFSFRRFSSSTPLSGSGVGRAQTVLPIGLNMAGLNVTIVPRTFTVQLDSIAMWNSSWQNELYENYFSNVKGELEEAKRVEHRRPSDRSYSVARSDHSVSGTMPCTAHRV